MRKQENSILCGVNNKIKSLEFEIYGQNKRPLVVASLLKYYPKAGIYKRKQESKKTRKK